MIMEKRKPHYSLGMVKALVERGRWRMTNTAKQAALRDFKARTPEVATLLTNLLPEDFYKSMTSYADTKSWQDVYLPVLSGIAAYVKISIDENGAIVISLKRK